MENYSLQTVWCKLCEFANILLLLCQGLSNLAVKFTVISMNNVEIKDKIVGIVGDPTDDCPACPAPGDKEVAQQEVTQALVAGTADMALATDDIKAKAVALKTAIAPAKKAEKLPVEETPTRPGDAA